MFEDALYKVKNKDGNEVTVESEDGVQYRRNSAHVKRYETEEYLNPEPMLRKPQLERMEFRVNRNMNRL